MTMAGAQRSTDGQTRRRIMSALLKSGSATAADLADDVGLSPAGVRRHLDRMLADEVIEPCPDRTRRSGRAGRGRPAQHFQLTRSGRESFGSGYDELALEAFAAVEAIGGRDAVKQLARTRAETLLGSARSREDSHDTTAATRRVAEAFAAHGYAAEANNVGSGLHSGLQLCQHHCPVQAVAARYPEICEAEHEVISELVGSHVAPLALKVNGDAVCTTHIGRVAPAAPAGGTQMERSGGDD